MNCAPKLMISLQKALGFWLGLREAAGVSWDEKFKCGFCAHSETCARKPPQPPQGQAQQQQRLPDEFGELDGIFAALPDSMVGGALT